MTYGGERLELEIRHTPKQICAERKNCNNDAKDSEEQFTKNNNKTRILDTPQIEDKRDGTYRIKFTPNESGTYVISVRIHGQHILVIIQSFFSYVKIENCFILGKSCNSLSSRLLQRQFKTL